MNITTVLLLAAAMIGQALGYGFSDCGSLEVVHGERTRTIGCWIEEWHGSSYFMFDVVDSYKVQHHAQISFARLSPHILQGQSVKVHYSGIELPDKTVIQYTPTSKFKPKSAGMTIFWDDKVKKGFWSKDGEVYSFRVGEDSAPSYQRFYSDQISDCTSITITPTRIVFSDSTYFLLETTTDEVVLPTTRGITESYSVEEGVSYATIDNNDEKYTLSSVYGENIRHTLRCHEKVLIGVQMLHFGSDDVTLQYDTERATTYRMVNERHSRGDRSTFNHQETSGRRNGSPSGRRNGSPSRRNGSPSRRNGSPSGRRNGSSGSRNAATFGRRNAATFGSRNAATFSGFNVPFKPLSESNFPRNNHRTATFFNCDIFNTVPANSPPIVKGRSKGCTVNGKQITGPSIDCSRLKTGSVIKFCSVRGDTVPTGCNLDKCDVEVHTISNGVTLSNSQVKADTISGGVRLFYCTLNVDTIPEDTYAAHTTIYAATFPSSASYRESTIHGSSKPAAAVTNRGDNPKRVDNFIRFAGDVGDVSRTKLKQT